MAYQLTPVTCSSCGRQFSAPVLQIVDVSRQPALKEQLLRGQLNLAACPQCGNVGMLAVPFLYHDPDKELLLAFMPAGLEMNDAEQQRLIGTLTNQIMTSLPAEQRKGYLLQPKIFFTLSSLLDEILMADGYTREMLNAQQARVRLLQRFLKAVDDEVIQYLVKEHDQELDEDFFGLLSSSIERAYAEGQMGIVQQLGMLQEKLLQWSSWGQRLKRQREAVASLGETVTREELLEKIVAADDEAVVEALVAAVRPLVDQVFMQALAGRTQEARERGEIEEAQRLETVQEQVAQAAEKADAAIQASLNRAARLLVEILQSEDPIQTLQRNFHRIDDAFMTVLAVNIERAQEQGELELARQLQALLQAILEIMQMYAPPEIQLINRLLEADYPEGTQALLEANRSLVTDELVHFLGHVAENMDEQGRSEVAQRLREVSVQAQALLAAA